MIPAVITQMFNPNKELVIPTGISTKEAKAEMNTHPIIVEITISECLISFKTIQTSLCLLLINSF